MAEVIADIRYRLPEVKIHHDFKRKPTGPFYVAIHHDYFKRDLTLEEAFEEFVRYAMPPNDGACIVDHNGLVTIGYLEDEDGHIGWYGLEAGYDIYRDHPLTHPLEYEMAVQHASSNL